MREPTKDYVALQEIKIKLADGKVRQIQHMMSTTFWHADGTPMSVQQFMEILFGKLSQFFKDEAELRMIWSAPDMREELLQGIAEKVLAAISWPKCKKIIEAENSDLFDVLAHEAYVLTPLNGAERAARASAVMSTHFNTNQ